MGNRPTHCRMASIGQRPRTELRLIRMGMLLPIGQLMPRVFLSHLAVHPGSLQRTNDRIPEAVVPHPATTPRLDAQLDQVA